MIKFQSASECVRYFYNSYLIERNHENLAVILNEKSSFFGTKLMEVASCYEETVELLHGRNNTEAKNFEVKELWLTETPLSQEIFLVNGELELTNTAMGNLDLEGKNRIRLTAICKKMQILQKLRIFIYPYQSKGLLVSY